MQSVTISTGSDQITVFLKNDLTTVDAADQIYDESKIAKKLEKAKVFAETKGKVLIGVAAFKTADLTFFDDNTFNGRVWAGGFPISGKYDLF